MVELGIAADSVTQPLTSDWLVYVGVGVGAALVLGLLIMSAIRRRARDQSLQADQRRRAQQLLFNGVSLDEPIALPGPSSDALPPRPPSEQLPSDPLPSDPHPSDPPGSGIAAGSSAQTPTTGGTRRFQSRLWRSLRTLVRSIALLAAGFGVGFFVIHWIIAGPLTTVSGDLLTLLGCTAVLVLVWPRSRPRSRSRQRPQTATVPTPPLDLRALPAGTDSSEILPHGGGHVVNVVEAEPPTPAAVVKSIVGDNRDVGNVAEALSRMLHRWDTSQPLPDHPASSSLVMLAACLEEDAPFLPLLSSVVVYAPPAVSELLGRATEHVREGGSIAGAVPLLIDDHTVDDAALLDAAEDVSDHQLPAFLRTLSRIVADDAVVARAERRLGQQQRLVVAVSIVVPVLLIAVRLLIFVQLPDVVPLPQGVVAVIAAALFCLGLLWLRETVTPPVSPGVTASSRQARRDTRDRAHAETAITHALDVAALRATQDVSLAEAIEQAGDINESSRELSQELRRLQSLTTADLDPFSPTIISIAQTLVAADRARQPARATLVALGTRLRIQSATRLDADTQRMPRAAVFPFLLCMLPAGLLLVM